MQQGKRQDGLTFISWLIIFAVGGFFVLLGLKLVPIYLENQSVKSVVESLNNDPLVRKADTRGVYTLINKRLKINSIYDFPKENIKIKKTRNQLIVDITYDKIEPIVGNISVMVSFSEQLNVELTP
ncbi:MAG: DUF4845 domain-containing protein [Chromatiales bacterium]|jgi:hypothetical protein